MSATALQYVDPRWGFKFNFPAAWDLAPAVAPGLAAVVVGPAGFDNFRVNLVATVEEQVGQIDQWRERSEEMLADSVPLFHVLDRVRIPASSVPAVVTTVTFAGPNAESVTQMIWASTSGEVGFVLTASCSTVDFPTYAALFEHVLLTCTPPTGHPQMEG